MSIPCAKCAGPMDPQMMGKIELDICASCGARWHDHTEFHSAVSHERPGVPVAWGEPVNRTPPRDALLCPRDRSPLREYEWLGVYFYRCTRCRGLLIGHGDWERLVNEALEGVEKDSLTAGLLVDGSLLEGVGHLIAILFECSTS